MKKAKKILGSFVLVCALVIMPNKVSADQMSDEFKTVLNEEGKLVINAIKPNTEKEAMLILGDYLYETTEKIHIDPETCNSDYTTCELKYNPGWQNEIPEKHQVDIIYNYNEDIKTFIEGYSSKIPESLEYFEVKDMELINYWVNGQGNVENLINYSSQLKSYFDYKNFIIDLRMGNNAPFHTMASGIANFTYDGVLYGIRHNTGVKANHIIFVDEETGDTKEELLEAAEKRIEEYVGKNKVELKYEGQGIYNYFINDYDASITEYQEKLDAEMAKPEQERDQLKIWEYEFWLEEYTGYKEYFIESYNSEDGENAFLKNAEGDFYFSATINGEDENKYLFIIVKDNDSMINPTYKTSDINTDVTISSEDSSIPLDTLAQVNKLTSGKEYEEIIKLLEVTAHETFDVNLYSKSLEDYITKLEDGTFEVKIPVSENLKGKNLIAYYVDKNEKIQEYKVTIKDGYAIFTTDHFSIYTLAEADILPPKTGDGITTYFIIGIISLIGLFGIAICIKKVNILK